MVKISEKIAKVQDEEGTVVSFEFFPAKTEEGVGNLLSRIRDMASRLRPTFVTLTWRSAFKDESLWLKIGKAIQNDLGVDVMLHLTCHLPKADLRRILNNARAAGIQNILALRGDPPLGANSKWRPVPGGLKNAYELVQLIREDHGDYFCVAVAGYPEVHTESWNSPHLPPSEQTRQLDLDRLKAKIDAGADMVITQFFYDIENFLEFFKRCQEAGIRCPILPGYMIPQTYQGFQKFTQWCRTVVPPELKEALEATKHDDRGVKQVGIDHAVKTARTLFRSGIRALHIYTMNLSLAATRTLESLGLTPTVRQRPTPWGVGPPRAKEEVRPIFWTHRQDSYLARTADWDEYPNGRWGDSRSPAYGEITDYYLAHKQVRVDTKALWGTPQCFDDVKAVFLKYLKGEISQLPWASAPLSGESLTIVESLKWINKNGFLTINSQPKVNGLPSSHPDVGWGGDDGYVFQKAYVEFFVSPETFKHMLPAFERHPELTYHAMDRKGREYMNSPRCGATAVTWGVFPGREIIQPTVVDPVSFRAWKDEAFELWLSQWQRVYEDDTPEQLRARAVLQDIHDTFFLVNIVDNSYAEPGSDLFQIFREVIVDTLDEKALRSQLTKLEAENSRLTEHVSALTSAQRSAAKTAEQMAARLRDVEKENGELRARVAELEAATAVAMPFVAAGAGGAVASSPPAILRSVTPADHRLLALHSSPALMGK